MMPTLSSTVRAALNRLIIVCRDEVIALEAAALTVGGERRRRLDDQVARRVVFQADLASAVAALGAVPAKRGSPGSRLANALYVARSFFVRSRRVELYDACACATDKTARVYAGVLKLKLTEQLRLVVQRQYDEIERDRNELCWLRLGGTPSVVPTAIAPR